MKACPLCNSTYDDRVDFCFRDGAPLVAASAELEAAALAEKGLARFSTGLDVPEPHNLDVTDAPEPTSLRAPIVAPPTPPPPEPLPVESGEPTLPPQAAPDIAPPPAEDLPAPEPVSPPLPDPSPDEIDTVVPPTETDDPDLTEPDTSEFFADLGTETRDDGLPDADDDDDEEDADDDGLGLYADIPYAETPPRKDRMPVILAAIAGVIVIGGMAVFGFGGDDKEPDAEEPPAATASVQRPSPAADREPRQANPKPATRVRTPPVEEVEERPPIEPEEPVEQPRTAATTPSAETDQARQQRQQEARKEQRRQERAARKQAEAERRQAQADRAAAERLEEERRQAARAEDERRAAERREAERRAAENQASSEPVAVSSPSDASNPWGQADEPTQGVLTVTSTPRDATVWIDDVKRGSSPVDATLPFGSHKVRVTKSGYKDKTMVIDLQSRERDVAFSLVQDVRSGAVTIYGTLGAKVYLGDKLLGPIPVSTSLQEGTYTFTVVNEGTFYKVTKTISFEGVQGTLPLTLTPQ